MKSFKRKSRLSKIRMTNRNTFTKMWARKDKQQAEPQWWKAPRISSKLSPQYIILSGFSRKLKIMRCHEVKKSHLDTTKIKNNCQRRLHWLRLTATHWCDLLQIKMKIVTPIFRSEKLCLPSLSVKKKKKNKWGLGSQAGLPPVGTTPFHSTISQSNGVLWEYFLWGTHNT